MIPASSPVIIIESGNNSMKYMYSKLAGTTTKGGGEGNLLHLQEFFLGDALNLEKQF